MVFAECFQEHCGDAEIGFSYPAGGQKHMACAGQGSGGGLGSGECFREAAAVPGTVTQH